MILLAIGLIFVSAAAVLGSAWVRQDLGSVRLRRTQTRLIDSNGNPL